MGIKKAKETVGGIIFWIVSNVYGIYKILEIKIKGSIKGWNKSKMHKTIRDDVFEFENLLIDELHWFID